MQAMKHVRKGSHPGFETQGRLHQKYKTGISVAPQKDSCPPKLKKNNKKNNSLCSSILQCLYFVTNRSLCIISFTTDH